MLISLSPFSESDFSRLINWIKTEDQLIQFAGPIFSFPLSEDQLAIYIRDKRRIPLTIACGDQIIGHCELNFQNEIPRLSRILIGAGEWRNKGIGKTVVRQMLSRIFSTTSFTAADLSVFDWNANAIACYRSIGFKIQEGAESSMQAGDKTWNAITMNISKEAFFNSWPEPTL